KDQISVEDARRDALKQRLNAEQTAALLGKLERAGWLKKTTEQTPGRARHRWIVNAQLLIPSRAAGSAESAGSTPPDTLRALRALPAGVARDTGGEPYDVDEPYDDEA